MSETAASPFARRRIGSSPKQQVQARCITVPRALAQLLWGSTIWSPRSPKAVRAARFTTVRYDWTRLSTEGSAHDGPLGDCR
jgi:hypothetical protein